MKEETVLQFIQWRNRLKSETRGGVIMYDIPGYYKWVTEQEAVTFFFEVIYSQL